MKRFLTALILLLAGSSLYAQQFQHIDPLFFTMPFGGANPLPQVLNLSSTGANFSFTAAASTSSGGSWLSVTPAGFCCTTPYNVQVIVTAPVALASGTYNGQVLFSTGSTSLTVPVTLMVAAPGSAFFDNMPGGLSFTATPGSPSFASQVLQVRNGNPGALNWSLTATTFNSGNWLTVSATSGAAPSYVTVGVTAANLPNAGLTAGVFTGTLTFQGAGNTITVPVSVTIGATVFDQINGLSFAKPFGGADPLDQVLQVASPGAAISFTATAVSATGGKWLSVSPSGFCCTTPHVLSVSVSPSVTLAAGTYTGQVFITDGTNAIVIPVNLVVAAPGTSFFDNMPGQLSFTVKTAGPNPPAQMVQVRNGGAGDLNWTLVSSTYNNGAWLTVTPLLGAAPGFVSVQISVAKLPNAGLVPGQFMGQILFQTPGGNVTVPVSVVVGASVFEQVNGITFTKPLNGANPLPQVLTIAGTGAAFAFTATAISATGGNWLAVSPSGFCCDVPSILKVSATPDVTLPAGTYTGEVLVDSGTQAITVPVTLIIGDPATPFFDNLPGQLSYSMKTGGPSPTSQLVQIRNGGSGTLNWTATAATSDGGAWLTLSAASGTAPSNVVIGINASNLPSAGLVAGVFTGTVLFQSGENTATIPISVAVGGNSFAQMNPLAFTKVAAGPNPLPQILTVTSIGSAIAMTASAASATGGNWLTVTPTGFCCNTPTVFTVSVNAAVTLGAGTYTGQVEFASGSTAITVPVTLTVAPPNAAVFDNVQGGMSFYSPLGGAALSPQTIPLRNAGTGALNWTAVANTFDSGNWLTVSSASGAAPGDVTIGVITGNLPNQGLVAGVATGQILFQSSAGNITVPVSVQLGTNIFVQPAPLVFSKSFGAASPLAQSLTPKSGGTNFSYTASATAGNGGSWLSVSPSGFCCNTPTVETVTVTAPAAFPAGAYTGQLVFNQSGMAAIVPVFLTVDQPSLSIGKTHSGSFAQGQNGVTYSVVVGNGLNSAPTTSPVTVTETVPSGLTLTAMSGDGWGCGGNTCTRGDVLRGNTSYPPITVAVNVAANATTPQVNTVSVSGGGSAGANATDSTTITAAQQGTPLVITTSATLLTGFIAGAYIQDLSAAGGSGGYTWKLTLGALPAGLALSGAAITGTPTAAGTFGFTLQVTDSASNTASQAFSLTVTGGATLSRVGVLSQFAAGGGFTTAIWVVNTSSAPVPVRLIFHADDGTLVLKDASGNVTPTPLTVAQQGDTQVVTATTLDRVLNAKTGLVITCGSGQAVNVQGWVDVLATATVSGFAVFTYAPGGLTPGVPGFVTPWEGTVPLQTQLTPTTMALPFDNTNGFNNGVAIGTLSNSAATITATFYDINGNALGTPQTIPLAANGHTSFMLFLQYPFTANKQGSVVFTGATVMGLGLRASPYGTLTAVPTVLQ